MGMSQTTTTDLLRYAISRVNDTYGLTIEQVDSDVADARVQLGAADNTASLLVEVKRWANHIDTELLLIKLSRKSPLQDIILIAQYINPKMAG